MRGREERVASVVCGVCVMGARAMVCVTDQRVTCRIRTSSRITVLLSIEFDHRFTQEERNFTFS